MGENRFDCMSSGDERRKVTKPAFETCKTRAQYPPPPPPPPRVIMFSEKNCFVCGRLYRPSSKHKTCPSCRYKATKDLCECGQPKQKECPRCSPCTNRYRSGPNSPSWKGGRSYK